MFVITTLCLGTKMCNKLRRGYVYDLTHNLIKNGGVIRKGFIGECKCRCGCVRICTWKIKRGINMNRQPENLLDPFESQCIIYI